MSGAILDTDFLVIGSGIAGLWFSLRAARTGRVLIVTKKQDTESNTNYAQGGIAAAFGIDDSPDLHVQDTIRAGEGLCREEAVRAVAEEGPRLVDELSGLGVAFDTYNDTQGRRHFQLGREGGHLRSRIVHARDYTGQAVEHGLVRTVKEHPRVTMLENRFCRDLTLDRDGRCVGAVIQNEASGELSEVRAGRVLLATGGIGQVYPMTTNPPIATGDGIAIAFRAGARIANMEFIQFHPTALHGHEINGRAFLISEAVRGEGGVLKTRDGRTFMEHYHELANLAPRDVVARAVDAEMKRRGEEFVLLDVTHLDPERVRSRFPNIHRTCLSFGIDITARPIPVVPAAHYACGGILADVSGRTSIPGLFAVGECACSGLHGANRLASNSLVEALVMADRAAQAAVSGSDQSPGPYSRAEPIRLPDSAGSVGLRAELRAVMGRYAAIVKSESGLEQAGRALAGIASRMPRAASGSEPAALELANMLAVARLIVRCAVLRKESRGLHYNVDFPGRDDVHFRRDTVVTREDLDAD
jgi:L-aspartate oxidase